MQEFETDLNRFGESFLLYCIYSARGDMVYCKRLQFDHEHTRERMCMSRAPGYEQTQPRSGGKRGSAGLRIGAGRTRTGHIYNGIKKEGEV